ncbi:MAG: glycosyltransferase [Alphaproteobacteria bacterium]|nr:glycosyltransferase [Alphaproteobacteria bacterium]
MIPRVLQVMAGAETGGAETAFADMVLALHEAGVPQQVVTRKNTRNESLIQAGIPVFTLPFGSLIDIYTSFALRGIIRRFKPDIVQTWMSRAAQHTPADKKHYMKVSRLGGYYKMKYFRTTDYFTTITPKIRDYLTENGVSPAHVRHINNFAEVPQDTAPVTRESLNTPENAFVVLALSRLHKAKGLDTLIKTVAPLKNTHVWLAGEGPDREKLEALAQAEGAANRIHFLGWRDDRDALLKACDAVAFPSRYEPFGTTFVQAWAARKPLVTTASDGPAAFVRDGEDGLMVPIDNIDALREAIDRLQKDSARQTKLINNGWQRYQNEFTKTRAVEAYLDYYRHILRAEGLRLE